MSAGVRPGAAGEHELEVEVEALGGFFDRLTVVLTGNLGEDPTNGGEWVRGRVAVQRGEDPVWLTLFARGDSRGALWRQREGQKVLTEGSLSLRTQRVRRPDGQVVDLVVVEAVNVSRVYALAVRKRDEAEDAATVETAVEPLPDRAEAPAGALEAHLGGWPPAGLPPISVS